MLTRAKTKKFRCCLCGGKFEGFGNNPFPLRENGRCCDGCNATQVIPARLERHYALKAERAGKGR
jgi:hypothetical protein